VKRVVLALVAAGVAAVAAFAATGPDPSSQAQADGCGRDLTAIFKGDSPNWVYVGDKDAPATGPPPAPQRVAGVADAGFAKQLAAHPTPVDDPLTHLSYDFNVNVNPDSVFASLLGTGRPGASTPSASRSSCRPLPGQPGATA